METDVLKDARTRCISLFFKSLTSRADQVGTMTSAVHTGHVDCCDAEWLRVWLGSERGSEHGNRFAAAQRGEGVSLLVSSFFFPVFVEHGVERWLGGYIIEAGAGSVRSWSCPPSPTPVTVWCLLFGRGRCFTFATA